MKKEKNEKKKTRKTTTTKQNLKPCEDQSLRQVIVYCLSETMSVDE